MNAACERAVGGKCIGVDCICNKKEISRLYMPIKSDDSERKHKKTEVR